MQELDTWTRAARARVAFVFTDIDDTLTLHGRLPAAAFAALHDLAAAGIRVVPVTGRPAGWCDQIARLWPVDGVVGENGAFWFRHDEQERRLRRRFLQDEAQRAHGRARLEALGRRILAEVPGTALASDQGYRESDLAIDFCEDVPALPRDAVDRIVALFESEGATAKVSSIHVNGWFGDYDKLAMCRLFMRECHGVELEALLDQAVFVGDSPNDAPMFGFFPASIGVANVRHLQDRIAHLPAYVTQLEGGLGFRQVADALLEARGA